MASLDRPDLLPTFPWSSSAMWFSLEGGPLSGDAAGLWCVLLCLDLPFVPLLLPWEGLAQELLPFSLGLRTGYGVEPWWTSLQLEAESSCLVPPPSAPAHQTPRLVSDPGWDHRAAPMDLQRYKKKFLTAVCHWDLGLYVWSNNCQWPFTLETVDIFGL